MAILEINGEDFSSKLTAFELKCSKCGSSNVKLTIDWAAYPSASWCDIDVDCEDCLNSEEVYGS